MDQISSLNGLRAFEAVARHLNFSKAARELFVTQGAVSRQVKKLEEALSVELFVRVPNRLRLTPEGEILYRGTQQAFTHIRDAVKTIEKKSLKFKIVSAPTIATRWLIPRLYLFQEKNPALQIQLETSVKIFNFRHTHDFDVAITYGKPVGGMGLACEHLFNELLYPVYSPKLIIGDNPIQRLEDLSGHCLLHSSLGRSEWKAWAKMRGVDNLKCAGDQIFELEESTIQAARAGAGVALVNLDFVRDEVAAGELLVMAPRDLPVHLDSYYLVYDQGKTSMPSLKKFKQWLLAERDDFILSFPHDRAHTGG